MSFNDIILPKTVIAEIYKGNLVELIPKNEKKNLRTAIEDVSSKLPFTPQFLGKNLRNIVILVHYSEVAHLPEEQLEFLKKILTACKLNVEDIAVINTAKEQAHEENIQMMHPRSILIFGDCVSNILDGQKIDFFSPISKNDVSIMTSPSLEMLFMTTNESRLLKSKLWLSLQQFFKI